VTIPGPAEVLRDVEAALDRHGLRTRRIELVSPLGERKGIRFAYRVDADDGRSVKVRHFGTAEDARRHFGLRAGLEAAFSPVLAHHGPVVLEEWVEGVPLGDLESEALAAEAGALLGRLHARPFGPDTPSVISTRKWIEGADSDLAILTSAGVLACAEADRLAAELRRRDPMSARTALVHLDFCAENMLIDPRGELRVIDNELLAINPPGLDVGRTFHRWPMSEATWACFLGGYRSAAPGEPEAIGFWKIAAALVGTRVFLQRIPQRVAPSVALLRRFAAGERLSDPPP
jgi:Ser/Thr protein kinase RdoA (MazF antagonist)